MYGLGSCDMKAGLACALTTLKAFADSGFDFEGELLFSGVVDEEAYSKGARAMLKTGYAKCDAILLCEPYPGDESKPIPLGITGKILYDVEVRGGPPTASGPTSASTPSRRRPGSSLP